MDNISGSGSWFKNKDVLEKEIVKSKKKKEVIKEEQPKEISQEELKIPNFDVLDTLLKEISEYYNKKHNKHLGDIYVSLSTSKKEINRFLNNIK